MNEEEKFVNEDEVKNDRECVLHKIMAGVGTVEFFWNELMSGSHDGKDSWFIKEHAGCSVLDNNSKAYTHTELVM
jgi:hypothetical protein